MMFKEIHVYSIQFTFYIIPAWHPDQVAKGNSEQSPGEGALLGECHVDVRRFRG